MTLYDRQQSRQAMKAIRALFRQPCLEQRSKQHFSPVGRPVIAAGITRFPEKIRRNPNEQRLKND